jgi:HEAT repeat protein
MAIAEDSSDDSQPTAINALGEIGPAAVDAAPLLLRLAAVGDLVHRDTAILALAKMETSVLPLLLQSLHAGDAAIVQSACMVLRRMGPKANDAVPVLASIVLEKEEMLRASAVLTLAEIGPAALEQLAGMLRHEDANVRRLAAMAFSRMGTEAAPALSALCKAAGDRDASVRFWAVGALGAIRSADDKVADCFIRTSLDENADVRWQTAVALSRTGVNASMRQVLANLRNDAHPAVRDQAKKVNRMYSSR